MTKRIALLTGIALIAVLSAAPDAKANHCFRCKLAQMSVSCVAATGTTPGYPVCESDGFSCQTSGTRCAAHTASVAPLASEYQVASVERLDDAAKTDVAKADAAKTEVAESATR